MKRATKRQELQKQRNTVLDNFTKGLEGSLECQELQTEILKKKVSKRKKRKDTAKAKAMGNKTIQVLIADEGDNIYEMACNNLGQVNGTTFNISKASSFDHVCSAINEKKFDIILVDCKSFTEEDKHVERFIKVLNKKSKHVPIIVYGPENSYECDMMAMEAGAADYISEDELTAKRLEKSIRYCICNKS